MRLYSDMICSDSVRSFIMASHLFENSAEHSALSFVSICFSESELEDFFKSSRLDNPLI